MDLCQTTIKIVHSSLSTSTDMYGFNFNGIIKLMRLNH